MSKSYKSFVFEGYDFDVTNRKLKLKYGFDNELHFTETLTFDFAYTNYDKEILDRAILPLYFLAGVSYYKAYRTETIRIDHGKMDAALADFISETYQKGLGEYFYVNRIDPNTDIPFMANAPAFKPLHHASNGGMLIGLGGGKDSLVSVELLRDLPHAATWSLGHRAQLEPLVKEIGLPHLWVERALDPLLFELNSNGALNGHIPISAILGAVGTVTAVLTGYKDAVVSNENSSNEATLVYDGVEVNHQYSKSLAYEKNFQKYLQDNFGESLRYYSFLRPLSEVKIAEMFAKIGFQKYKKVFSSCNRAFIQESKTISWCGHCSKCAFTFLALTPFIDRKELESMWHKNVLMDPTLVITYENLLGISGEKPLDCVGEVKESRAAMRLAQDIYKGLNYEFDIPEDYSYQSLAGHSMPKDKYDILSAAL